MTDHPKGANLKASLDLASKRKELEQERDHLRVKLGEVDDKLRALDLLKDRKFLDFVLSTTSNGGGDASASPASAQATPHSGLRAAIRAVLADSAQPMKPLEVTAKLYDQGHGGGRDLKWLKLRVSQEMHRMMDKQKQLKRLPSGRYRLVSSEGDVEA